MTPKLTKGAIACMLYGHDGIGFRFHNFIMGSGPLPAVDDYMDISAMSNPLSEGIVGIDAYSIEDGYIELTGTFSNAHVTSAFDWTEVGIFVEDPNSTEEEPLPDILYAYGHVDMSEEPTAGASIPKSGAEVFEITLKYRVYVGELDNVTAAIADSANYATKQELTNHTEDTNNPHNVTAEQLGIDAEFLNGSVNQLEVTYTTPTETAELSSGENMTTAFGKIAKAIKDLIAHIANKSNPHGVTLAQIGAAADSHNHSATNITSGTLNVARGGTGKGSVTTGALMKGAGTGAFGEVSGVGALYAATRNNPTFGTLPVSCGGTGATTKYDACDALGAMWQNFAIDPENGKRDYGRMISNGLLIQWGDCGAPAGNTDAYEVSLPLAYKNVNSYVVMATIEGVGATSDVTIRVQRTAANKFTARCFNNGSPTHTIGASYLAIGLWQ